MNRSWAGKTIRFRTLLSDPEKPFFVVLCVRACITIINNNKSPQLLHDEKFLEPALLRPDAMRPELDRQMDKTLGRKKI